MKRHKWLVLMALIAAFALVAAACAEEEAEEEPEVTPPEVVEPPDDAIGVVEIGPGEPVKIASLQAISGAVASLGEDQNRAIEIAIDDKGGELLGHPIEFQPEDDLCSAEGGTTGMTKIVADPQIVGVIGTSCSGAGVPASEIMSEAGLVMISGSNTSPALTATGYLEPGDLVQSESNQPGYFRTAHNDEFQGQGAAQFLRDEAAGPCGSPCERLATIHDGDPYTEGLATQTGKWFEEFGGEVVLATAINKGDTDMRPVLTEVAASGADALFFPIFQPEGDFMAKQAKEVEGMEGIVLMGADGLLSDTFVEIPETEGMYLSGPARAGAAEAYETFVATYEAKYGEKPIQSFHAHSYDATNMLFEAVEQVGVQTEDGTLYIGRQALRDALYATSGFVGLTGTLSCNEFGDCAAPSISVYLNADPTIGIFGTVANPVFSSEAVIVE